MMEVRLIEPEARFAESYREALEEYRDFGIDDYAFTDAEWPALHEKFENSRAGIRLKPGRVPAEYYWLVCGDEFIGEIVIRRELNDLLLRYGGHIGYGVRRSRWRQGFGTLMLRMALERARQMGFAQVLITCDDDNSASAAVIERNGGKLQGKIRNHIHGEEVLTRRYWVKL